MTTKTRKTPPLGNALTAQRKRALRRVELRPTRDLWKADEPMTIAEAVALDVTAGALSEKGIRTAIENKSLSATKLNGKFWITIGGVEAAFAPTLVPSIPDVVTANDNAMIDVKVPTAEERVIQLIRTLAPSAKL